MNSFGVSGAALKGKPTIVILKQARFCIDNAGGHFEQYAA
jgi:hypothetical protein